MLVNDRTRGIRAHLTVRGRITRMTIELRDVPRPARATAARTLTGFALALASRLDNGSMIPDRRKGSGIT